MYRRRRTRRPYRRRRTRRGGGGFRPVIRPAWRAARNLWYDVKRLKNMVNAEFKSVTAINNATHTPSTTPSRLLLNPLGRGDDIDQRHGRVVRARSVEIDGHVTINSSATNTRLRVVLLLDTHPDGVTPTYPEVFNHATSVVAVRNLDNRRRFIILRDFLVQLNNSTRDMSRIKLYKQLNFHQIFDDSNAGDITDIKHNALYLFLISDEATNAPSVHLTTRYRYVDN